VSAKPGRLERRLDAWARWVVSGGQDKAPPSLLARWMAGKGHIVFGGGSSAPSDVIETVIEATVMQMFAEDALGQLRADVLRLEFGAGSHQVAQRRGIKGFDPRTRSQAKMAEALGISYRTYRRRLAEAKAIVNAALTAALPPREKATCPATN
jgi:hypothetical protein